MAEEQVARSVADPPATPAERLLAGFWEELLEVQGVGRGDRLVELGGNSLVATMLANRIEEALGYRPSLTEIFARSLGELAAVCERGRSAAGPAGEDAA